MLAQHVPISSTDLCTFKYLIALHMGFSNCFVRRVRQEVQFEMLSFDPSNMRQRSIIFASLSGINRLLDVYQILKNPHSPTLPSSKDWIEDEQLVLGSFFIDIVIRALASDVDMTLMDDAMLRCWIESFIVTIYKVSRMYLI
jgi:hypothetical protein